LGISPGFTEAAFETAPAAASPAKALPKKCLLRMIFSYTVRSSGIIIPLGRFRDKALKA
jgi:hypothetical protein